MILRYSIGAILGAYLLLVSAPAMAQKMISVESDSCAAGLRVVGELFAGAVHPTSPPTHHFGKCEARDVNVNLSYGTVQFNATRLQWGNGDLATLASGQLPQKLNLKLRGVSISRRPDEDPFWVFLAKHSRGFRGIDAELSFTFDSSENRLTLSNAALDFHDGNRLRVTGELTHVRPSLFSRPKAFGMVLAARSLDVSIRGTRRFGNDIVTAIIADMPADARPESGARGLGAVLKQKALNNLATVLDTASMDALNQLLETFPHPTGAASVRLRSEGGIPLLKLLALSSGADAVKVLDGALVTFEYDSNIMAATN